jgi:hypothetical protein
MSLFLHNPYLGNIFIVTMNICSCTKKIRVFPSSEISLFNQNALGIYVKTFMTSQGATTKQGYKKKMW